MEIFIFVNSYWRFIILLIIIDLVFVIRIFRAAAYFHIWWAFFLSLWIVKKFRIDNLDPLDQSFQLNAILIYFTHKVDSLQLSFKLWKFTNPLNSLSHSIVFHAIFNSCKQCLTLDFQDFIFHYFNFFESALPACILFVYTFIRAFWNLTFFWIILRFFYAFIYTNVFLAVVILLELVFWTFWINNRLHRRSASLDSNWLIDILNLWFRN